MLRRMGSLETALNALDLSTLRNGLDYAVNEARASRRAGQRAEARSWVYIAHKCRWTLRERSASASIVRTI